MNKERLEYTRRLGKSIRIAIRKRDNKEVDRLFKKLEDYIKNGK